MIFVAPNESAPEGCEGNYEEPGAEEGNLCIFAGFEYNLDAIDVGNTEDNHFGEDSRVDNATLPEEVDVGTPDREGDANAVGNYKAGKYGFILEMEPFTTEGESKVTGTWAVTAE